MLAIQTSLSSVMQMQYIDKIEIGFSILSLILYRLRLNTKGSVVYFMRALFVATVKVNLKY